MSESPLPDDLARWPRDPYQLLGVVPGSSPRDIRRAYTRLIRVYKPEQHPEQFRRIREAYEAVLRHADLFARPGGEEVRGQEPIPVAPGQSTSPLALSLQEELDGVWRQALGGQERLAYDRLVRLHQQHTGSVAVYLRLYWLRVLFPDLGPARTHRDWLVQGLLATGLAGPLRALYREEVAEEPAEACGERFDRLLASDFRPELLAELLEWRWRALAGEGEWDRLAAEFTAQRPRFHAADEEAWFRLVLVVAGEAAWQTSEAPWDLLGRCLEEVRRHEHLAFRLRAEFDQLDFLLAASKAWRRAWRGRHAPPALLDLIALSWNRPFAEVRPLLEDVLASIDGDPVQWLGFFDLLRGDGSVLLAQFGGLLDQLQAAQEGIPLDAHPPAASRDLILEFLDRVETRTGYPGYRQRFLEFCIREALSPERVAEVTAERPDRWQSKGVALAQAILADWPLRHVYRACRLFWS